MIERGEYHFDPHIEEVIQEVTDYLGTSDVDSVRGQAFIDYDKHIELHNTRISQIDKLLEVDSDQKRRDLTFAKSGLRITEARIARLDDKIDEKILHIPGYEEEYQKAGEYRDIIGETIASVASELYHDYLDRRLKYSEEEMLKISDSIFKLLVNNKTA
jgi:L-lysine 2,3-aminomutase